MQIALGSDHAGRLLRAEIAKHLGKSGHTVLDVGTYTAESVDYPHYAVLVAQKITAGEALLGIAICGTGLGVSMAANRIAGVRAALCTDEFTARMSRAHNNANVLCMGERVVGVGLACSIVDTFLATQFEGGRHARRVDQLTALENEKV